MIRVLLVIFIFLSSQVECMHYKGGTITWKPTDAYSTADPVEILITEKHSWTLGRYFCDANTINTQGLYYDDTAGSTSGFPTVDCQSSSVSSCSPFTPIDHITLCTDFSNNLTISSGAWYEKQYLDRTTNIWVGWTGSAWSTDVDPSGNARWSVLTKIDLTLGTPINTSPVTGSLPIIRVLVNTQAIIQIPAADWDLGQVLKCRFANTFDECGDVCGMLTSANISASDCTIEWNAVFKTGQTASTYIAAIMVEDFLSTGGSALSAVPLQMVIYVYSAGPGACANGPPQVIGARPNRACIAATPGVQFSEQVYAEVYCNTDSIVEFITTSPLYMTKSSTITNMGLNSDGHMQFGITLTWTPILDQAGPQVFCACALDNNGLSGSQYCFTYVVGATSPDLQPIIAVQGTGSPVGVVFSNQSVFSIQASATVHRPNRNGTYIKIYHQNGTMVWSIDCGWSPDVFYTNQTIVFIVQNANWDAGALYYINFDSGASSGTAFCGPESAPITGSTFWNFTIWDSRRSSTTTTTTTAGTVPTVTTRPLSTTTPIPGLTTTGIALTSTTTVTTSTTTSTTSDTTSTTSTTTVTTATTTEPEMTVFSPKDFEIACIQPVTIMTAVMFAAMIPIHITAMFTMYLQLNKKYNPNKIAAELRISKFYQRKR